MPINKLTIENNTLSTTGTTSHQSAGVSVSGITGDYTIKLFVSSLIGSLRIGIDESANSFSTVATLFVSNLVGPLPEEGALLSFRKREAAGSDLAGTPNAEFRVNAEFLDANFFTGSGSVTYEAWIEY